MAPGNSAFACAMKGSSQRTAFISFDFPQPPLRKVDVIVPTLQMRELRLRGARQVPKSTGSARGPELLSPSPPAVHVTKAWALPHPSLACSQEAVCVQPRGELLGVGNIRETELSAFLVVYGLLS